MRRSVCCCYFTLGDSYINFDTPTIHSNCHRTFERQVWCRDHPGDCFVFFDRVEKSARLVRHFYIPHTMEQDLYSDEDVDPNDLDYDIHSGPPPVVHGKDLYIRLIWPLVFHIDALSSFIIANLGCDDVDVEQSQQAFDRVLSSVRRQWSPTKEQLVRDFFANYGVTRDRFMTQMRQTLYFLPHSFEWM